MLTRRHVLAGSAALLAVSCRDATPAHHDLANRIVSGIINPALEHLHGDGIPVSENARALLFAIGMAESGYRTDHQVGGPALGFWQMEPKTASDLLTWVGNKHQKVVKDIRKLARGAPALAALQTNPHYACALARCFFLRFPDPLPSVNLEAIARYWKKVWNTEAGKGTVSGFLTRVAPVWPKEWA